MTPYYDAGDNRWYDEAPTASELALDARIDAEHAADQENFDEHYADEINGVAI